MTFNWPHFLRISRLLSKYANETTKDPDMSESAFRSAISRAYYSAYGYSYEHAENFLGFEGSGSGEDHKELRDWYKNCGIPSIKRKLMDLWVLRKQADYHQFIDNSKIKSDSSIQIASEVIKEIDDIKPHK
jgi:hypothetical protein